MIWKYLHAQSYLLYIRILKIKNNEKKSFKYTIFTPKKLLFRTISLNEHVSKEVTNEAPWQRADYDVTI